MSFGSWFYLLSWSELYCYPLQFFLISLANSNSKNVSSTILIITFGLRLSSTLSSTPRVMALKNQVKDIIKLGWWQTLVLSNMLSSVSFVTALLEGFPESTLLLSSCLKIYHASFANLKLPKYLLVSIKAPWVFLNVFTSLTKLNCRGNIVGCLWE